MADSKKLYKSMGELRKRHIELDELLDYPPFNDIDDGIGGWDSDGKTPKWGMSIRTDRGDQFAEAMKDAFEKIAMEIKQGEVLPSTVDTLFDELEEDFKDDLEEARLYKKRFPEDYIEALKQAHKIVEK